MKIIKSVLLKVFMCSLMLVLLMPIFSCGVDDFSQAEGESETKYSLLSPQYNTEPSQTQEKYNIATSQTSSFTPFDFDKKTRMSGMSFTLPVDDKSQINNEFIYVDEVTDLNSSDMYSLYLWIYFDNTVLHDITITLEFSTNGSISWELTGSQLYSLIRKNAGVEISDIPYGWNKFELPFFIANVFGDVTNGDKYLTPTKLLIDFSSDLAESELTNIAHLRFYDIYLAESTLNDMISVEKQPYRFYSFSFIEKTISDSLCVGDSYTLPSFTKAVEYAWNGDMSLTSETNPTIVWKVVVKTPKPENEYITTNFGSKITFDTEGTYQIYYQCLDISDNQENGSDEIENSNKVILSGSQTINIRDLKAIYFSKSSLNVEVGKTYVIKVSSSSVFTEVSDYSFKASQNLEVVYVGNGYVEVTAVKEGEFKLEASVQASRPASPELKTYTSSLTITASQDVDDNNTVLKIVLWCVLGAIIVVLIGFGIKLLVKVNKYDVK